MTAYAWLGQAATDAAEEACRLRYLGVVPGSGPVVPASADAPPPADGRAHAGPGASGHVPTDGAGLDHVPGPGVGEAEHTAAEPRPVPLDALRRIGQGRR